MTQQPQRHIALWVVPAVLTLASAAPSAAQTLLSPDWTVSLDHQPLAAQSPFDTVTTRYAETQGSQARWTVRQRAVSGTPLAVSRPDSQPSDTQVTWRHNWTALHETTPSGLELSLSPHAGLNWDGRGSSAVAGATVRVGRGLDRLAPDGAEAFGERPRWYVFASGSKRAVGYNFTRRDGALVNEGLSHDAGHGAMGDAAIGVAWRKGPLQSSVGIAYREVEIDGLRGYGGRTTDVDEGVLAFQLSFRPQ